MEHPIFEQYRAKEEELQRVKNELKELNDQIKVIRANCKHEFETVVEHAYSPDQRQILTCRICGSMVK